MNGLDQIITDAMHRLGWPLEAFVDLMMAALAGGLVGLEREIRGRQAGFRTNLLVAAGSALVMIVSNRLAVHPWPSPGHAGVNVNIDPGRIAYGVMTGIGFLGAGVIIHHRGAVRGLTTAAAIWCVAALGLASGLGLYLLVCYTTVLLLAALWLLDRFERSLPKMRYRDVLVRRPWVDGCIEDTIRRLNEAGAQVSSINFRRTDDLRNVDIGARISFTRPSLPYELPRLLEGDRTLQLLALGEE
jgi:putative Mg2+ transporter-C (MgtC) family protein